MLKKLLPKELWKTRIYNNHWQSIISGSAFYNSTEDFIVFNRHKLLTYISYKNTREALKAYEPLIKTNKDLLIFALLHELGHRYFKDIEEAMEYNIIEKNIDYRGLNFIEAHFKYWDLLPEKKAMLFAKHFFKLYKNKEAEKANKINAK